MERERLADGIGNGWVGESRSGVEGLVTDRGRRTHAGMDAPARGAAGIGQGLLRLSVGMEACEDLEADLVRARRRAEAAVGDSAEPGSRKAPEAAGTTSRAAAAVPR